MKFYYYYFKHKIGNNHQRGKKDNTLHQYDEQ